MRPACPTGISNVALSSSGVGLRKESLLWVGEPNDGGQSPSKPADRVS